MSRWRSSWLALTTRVSGSTERWVARPAMKQPPNLRTGDPSYFVAASTSGSASPTVLTISNRSAGCCLIGLGFIQNIVSVLGIRLLPWLAPRHKAKWFLSGTRNGLYRGNDAVHRAHNLQRLQHRRHRQRQLDQH